MNKTKHFIYWLRKFVVFILFPTVLVKKGFRRDWMTWNQYKNMTNNLTKKLIVQ